MNAITMNGNREYARLPLILLALLLVICTYSVWDPPAGQLSWLLEVGPGLVGLVILLATYRRFPMSYFVYAAVFLHVLIINYGGIHTYAETPLGDWFRDTFELSRNHYDRVGHLALGVFPAFIIRELLLRTTPLQRGGWLYFLTISVVLAIAAFWELLEWWAVLLLPGPVGEDFLGSQGDIWDAHWDMLLALIGAMIVLPAFAWLHDRSMAHAQERCAVA
ncbi:MAG: DUF2238 domain-containing protein [Deltaproteobacteria bacterium]|nr:DUF2238 domain-containing protein [Deltaproteobacteria bacterium]